MKINYYIPKLINNYEEYRYNPENIYYKDKCLPAFSNNMVDMSLNERMEVFNLNNMSLCESLCTFKRYMESNIVCQCDVKFKFNSFFNVNSSKYSLLYRFKQVETKNQNFWVLKCYLNLFSKDIIKKNVCSVIVLSIIFFTFCGAVYFCAKEYKKLNDKMFMLYEISLKKADENFSLDDSKYIYFRKNNHNINQINIARRADNKKSTSKSVLKNISSHQSSKSILNSNKKKLLNFNEMKEYNKYTDNELNNLPYYNAIRLDRRNFTQIYFSLIKTKHLLLFAFNCKNDFNPPIMKISFMLFILVIFLASNTIFINETTIHSLFISNGKIEIFSDFSKIGYSLLISLSIKNILLLIAFPEMDVIKMRKIGFQNMNKRNKSIKKSIGITIIKCYIYFFGSILILSMIWIYISCFFMIFQNTQIYVIKNTLISFGISNIAPIILYLIPAFFRKLSVKDDGNHGYYVFYLLSSIFQVIF